MLVREDVDVNYEGREDEQRGQECEHADPNDGGTDFVRGSVADQTGTVVLQTDQRQQTWNLSAQLTDRVFQYIFFSLCSRHTAYYAYNDPVLQRTLVYNGPIF